MTERRYSEAEVAQIFERATETQHREVRQLPSAEGMTLGALQEIGREVGIAPELIAQAARALDQIGQAATRRFLGLPIGVARTVELKRRLTDAEWERLVVDLRDTFDARGTLREDGAFRQWTNGNLQALVEPTESGSHLRLRTTKGDARAFMTGGLAMLGVAGVSLVAALLSGALDAGNLSSLASLGAVAAGMFGVGAIRLPGWARLRRRQMEEIAGRLASSVTQPE
ncbi:MAG: hypothetical protein ACREON_01495 [Gemmatimonadaceae bacterium]